MVEKFLLQLYESAMGTWLRLCASMGFRYSAGFISLSQRHFMGNSPMDTLAAITTALRLTAKQKILDGEPPQKTQQIRRCME